MEDLHSLAAAYVLDALSGEEAAEFETHLAQCEACRLDVLEMNESASVRRRKRPDDLKRRLLIHHPHPRRPRIRRLEAEGQSSLHS